MKALTSIFSKLFEIRERLLFESFGAQGPGVAQLLSTLAPHASAATQDPFAHARFIKLAEEHLAMALQKGNALLDSKGMAMAHISRAHAMAHSRDP